MHIYHLPIPLLTSHYSSNNHQRISGDKIAYTSFVSLAVAGVGLKVEFEGRG